MRDLKGLFPYRTTEAMLSAILNGSAGNVAKHEKNAEQIWRHNRDVLLQQIDVRQSILEMAHPAAAVILLQHGQECRTRIRPYGHTYNGKAKNGAGQCWGNAILDALDTGMELWSGYACFNNEGAWHVWNVDAQGFVHDSTYGANSIFCRYHGIRLDPYAAHVVSKAPNQHPFEAMFLYWSWFPLIYGKCRRVFGEKVDHRYFARMAEVALAEIAA
ncbi:MAG: hypothetical protein JWN18_103 [Parcubacteria group bacterium]|nr:hypothetical protein [Parcubacteria group bacterium]